MCGQGRGLQVRRWEQSLWVYSLKQQFVTLGKSLNRKLSHKQMTENFYYIQSLLWPPGDLASESYRLTLQYSTFRGEFLEFWPCHQGALMTDR